MYGLDGKAGSGKSTLATRLTEALGDLQIVQVDDFYLSEGNRTEDAIGSNFDWRRLRAQVLEPLVHARQTEYQRYDWNGDTLGEWVELDPIRPVVVDGIYSTRLELLRFYHFRIWVDAPYEVRLARGIERDGEEARDAWVKDWMLKEDAHAESHWPYLFAHIVV